MPDDFDGHSGFEGAEAWFEKRDVGNGVTLLTEPFVHDIFQANMFHVRGRDGDLVIDAGMGLASLSEAIAPPSGRPVLAVATHVHADHVGSMHEFSARAGPRLSAEAFATMPDAATFADEFRLLAQPVSRAPRPGWQARDYRLQPAPLTRLLDEGDRIDLGDREFEVLALPGHSPDCIGLFDRAAGVLFSGDAIYDGSLYDRLPCSDVAAYRATMRRLLTLEVSVVHAGHGRSFGPRRMAEIARSYLDRTEP